MKITMSEWMEHGKYLPRFMRDFHDAKRVFKRINEIVWNRKQKTKGTLDAIGIEKLPDWVSAQIYVVDFFIWHMARHGYTLQKSRMPFEFYDLDADLQEFQKKWDAECMEVLFAEPTKK